MALKTIRPLGNRVLVKRQEAQDSVGGIFLPDSAKEDPKQGTIVAVGQGSHDEKGNLKPVSLRVGEEVLFQNYSGVKVESESGEELLLLSEDDVLGIIS